MKIKYRTDFGSLLFVGFGVFIFLSLTLSTFWLFGGASLNERLVSAALTIFALSFLLLMLKYHVIITEEAIHAKTPLLSFLNRYETMRFDEIAEVWNAIGPFSDMQNIIFKPRDKSKGSMSILVGFGLPWRVLVDILERLPKDAKVTFEPLLWKRVERLRKSDKEQIGGVPHRTADRCPDDPGN